MMMICFFIAHFAYADVTINGFCYLEGATDHSGTKILFTARSEWAVTDSVFTNSDGSYTINIHKGVYEVQSSHLGWQPQIIYHGYNFLINLTLYEVILSSGYVEEVVGPQFGVWPSGHVYHVQGDISINNGDTLIIEPGVIIKFMDYYSFYIKGTLIAIGTETDSIFFTSEKTFPYWSKWNHIFFSDSSNDNSIISYASIEHSYIGIYCYKSSPSFNNNCLNYIYEFGIYCRESSSPAIKNNTIMNSFRCGVACAGSTPIISNNSFTNNDYGIECFDSSPNIKNNIFRDNSKGISCNYSTCSPIISNNSFTNNNYGIECFGSSPNIKNNIFRGNSRGISCNNPYCSPLISNNTFIDNESGIVYALGLSTIINNIFYKNYYGIDLNSSIPLLEYNLFWENEISVNGTLPDYFGEITTVNANEDPCDTYLNLFSNPLFIDQANFDYHLTKDSPCINAGNPDSAYFDPDGTIADIGAFYFSATGISDKTMINNISIYPNPSSGIFNISFEGVRGIIQIKVLDLTGKVYSDFELYGATSVQLDLKELTTGIYFISLSGKDFKHVKKIVIQ